MRNVAHSEYLPYHRFSAEARMKLPAVRLDERSTTPKASSNRATPRQATAPVRFFIDRPTRLMDFKPHHVPFWRHQLPEQRSAEVRCTDCTNVAMMWSGKHNLVTVRII